MKGFILHIALIKRENQEGNAEFSKHLHKQGDKLVSSRLGDSSISSRVSSACRR